jgi:tetratricopeptide (TPR) repeat protein
MVWCISVIVPFVAAIAAAGQLNSALISLQHLLRSRNYAEALQLADTALQSSPANVRVLTMKGMALSGLGKDDQAIPVYRKALSHAPGYLAALEGVAQAEYRVKDVRAAVSDLNQVLAQRPHDPTTHAMLADLAFGEKNCKEATKHFRESESHIEKQPRELAEYAVCLTQLNKLSDALPVFERLIVLVPNDHAIRYDLALLQFIAAKPADADATLEPLLQNKKGDADPDVLDLASSVYEAQGLTPRATELLHAAIVLSPSTERYYLDFATLALVHSSYQAGVDMMTAGLSYIPRSAPIYLARGILRIQAGQYDEGENDLEEADRLDPTQVFSSEGIGIAEVQKSNLDGALGDVRRRLLDHPDDAFLHYLLAEILSRQGAQTGTPEFDEASAEALEATRLNPGLTIAHDTLADLYLRSGQLQKSTQQCRVALDQNPADQEALYHLIQALRKEGKSAETPPLLKRLADLRVAAHNLQATQNRYQLVELDHIPSDVPSQN